MVLTAFARNHPLLDRDSERDPNLHTVRRVSGVDRAAAMKWQRKALHLSGAPVLIDPLSPHSHCSPRKPSRACALFDWLEALRSMHGRKMMKTGRGAMATVLGGNLAQREEENAAACLTATIWVEMPCPARSEERCSIVYT